MFLVGILVVSDRRVTADMGTRSYIEHVLQTPAKGASAERNWRKIRTGMFVVNSMAKEVTEAQVTVS